MAFELSMVLPIHSKAHGLIGTEYKTFFAAGNSIFKLENQKIFFLVSLHGQIEDLSLNMGFIFARTKDKLYMIRNEQIISTMNLKSEFTFVVGKDGIFISNEKNITLFRIPKYFSPFPFQKISDMKAHTGMAISMKCIEKDKMILSIGSDYTVRLGSPGLSISKILFYFTNKPVEVFFEEVGPGNLTEDNKVVISEKKKNDSKEILDCLKNNYIIKGVCTGGKYFEYCTEKRKIITTLYIDHKIIAATMKNKTVFLLTDNQTIYAIKDSKKICLRVDMQGYEIKSNAFGLIVRGESCLNIYSCTETVIDNLLFSAEISRNSEKKSENLDDPQDLQLISSIPLPEIVDFSYNNEDIMVASSNNMVIKYKLFPNHISISNIYDVEKPISHIFYKKDTLVILTEDFDIKVLDTLRFVKFRDIENIDMIVGSTTNDDNTLFIFHDGLSYISILDIKTKSVVDRIVGLESEVSKIQVQGKFVFILLQNNMIYVYDLFTRRTKKFKFEETIHSLNVYNQNIILSNNKGVSLYNFEGDFVRFIGCKFESRARNEGFSHSKPATVTSISFDGRFLFCGGKCNEIKVFDVKTGTTQFTSQLSRNKEKEGYKKRLGNEKITTEFQEHNVIESLKLEYIPNGFIVFSREGVFVYRMPIMFIRPTLTGFNDAEELRTLIVEKRWRDAVQNAVRSEDTEKFIEIIKKIPSEEINQVVMDLVCPQELKEMINWFILNQYDELFVYWLNRIIFYHPGNLIDSDKDVIKLLKEKKII